MSKKQKLSKEYLLNNVLDFRSRVKKISLQSLTFEDNHILNILPTEPVQIIGINIDGTTSNCILFFHDKKREDLEIQVFDVNIQSFKLANLQLSVLKDSSDQEIKEIEGFITDYSKINEGDIDWVWLPSQERIGVMLLEKNFSYVHYAISEGLLAIALRYLERVEEKATINETVGAIKKEIGEIQIPELRNRILNETEKLENKIAEINKRIDSEIGGVRKIIGCSQEFQGFCDGYF